MKETVMNFSNITSVCINDGGIVITGDAFNIPAIITPSLKVIEHKKQGRNDAHGTKFRKMD